MARLAELGARGVSELDGEPESMVFALPKELRLYAHGQGYDMVERPLVREDEPMRIMQNMNIVVHPGIMNERVFMTNTDNYLIGSDGPGDS